MVQIWSTNIYIFWVQYKNEVVFIAYYLMKTGQKLPSQENKSVNIPSVADII